jgi:hypothetical protein
VDSDDAEDISSDEEAPELDDEGELAVQRLLLRCEQFCMVPQQSQPAQVLAFQARV